MSRADENRTRANDFRDKLNTAERLAESTDQHQLASLICLCKFFTSFVLILYVKAIFNPYSWVLRKKAVILPEKEGGKL